MTRLEILGKELEGECVDGCNRQWLDMATNVLQLNGINRNIFSQSVRELLEKGRGKYRNMYLKGPANCGKTFLFNSLGTIFNTFVNPASTSFAWVGAENSEIIFLNDFRWSPQLIPWQNMLLLLEGQTIHFSAPKTHHAQDILFDKDTPIFCTSESEIVSLRGGVLDDRETEIMAVRWRVFGLHHQIPESEQRNIPPCGRCFAKLILEVQFRLF